MADDTLDAKTHAKQIRAYTKEKPHYDCYADVLKRVLWNACKVAFPEAIVQARAKTVASFAEKCARRWETYKPDPVHKLTDLCGARAILQTQEQVDAVRSFIDRNFHIVEYDNKSLSLGENTFGYRDMHFIVQLDGKKSADLPISTKERQQIGDRKAEIQVRTYLQHAWADTLHDRLYKNNLQQSTAVKRTCGVLAALMEQGDTVYDQVTHEIDGLIANYTAYTAKADVEKEIDVQRLIIANTKDPDKLPALALRLAHLLAARGKHDEVIELLRPHREVEGALRAPLLLRFGYSLCRHYRDKPDGRYYRQGLAALEQARATCFDEDCPYADNLRKQASLRAKVLNHLGWALEVASDRPGEARKCYLAARELEPGNPYYLADMLEFESFVGRAEQVCEVMRTTLVEAVKTCREHAEAGIQLPHAYFTAGRLNLMLGAANDALAWYARGIHYCVSDTYCVPDDILTTEIALLRRDHRQGHMPAEIGWAIDLLELGQQTWDRGKHKPPKPGRKLTAPVLIVSGGAASLDADKETKKAIRPLLQEGLSVFAGTVTSGGTTAGVPGMVGDITAELRAAKDCTYTLVGYRPKNLPATDHPHPAYAAVEVGETYSLEQIIRNWQDIIRSGIDPRAVLLLGFGGGPMSTVEYRIALGLGADVAVVGGTGGAADALPKDTLWQLPNLYPMPLDAATFRAFLVKAKDTFAAKTLEQMAAEFHARYVADSTGQLPPKLKPWAKLPETYKRANIEQARYAIEIIRAIGLDVRASKKPVVFTGFTPAEIATMAELEHGRWNVERLRDGWRYDPVRNDDAKHHNCLLPWADHHLDSVRHYDEESMRAIPQILAKVGLEIHRAPSGR